MRNMSGRRFPFTNAFRPVTSRLPVFPEMAKPRFLGAIVGAAALGSLALVPSPAGATVVDPQIFVQQSGNAPAGGDPNLITNTGALNVGVAGNFTLQNPLLIIVGVYDSNGIPSISFTGGVSAAVVGTYGLTADTATFTSASSGSAFDQLGLSSGGSESFVNWSGADVANGFAAPTSFSLYAFALDTNLTSGSPITIDESGAAAGSYIIAYDCEDGTGTSAGCNTPGNIGQTVFTNTGLIVSGSTPVPEPASFALFGIALVWLGLSARWRRGH